MKKLWAVYSLAAILGASALTGCKSEQEKEAEHMRQMECVAATGDRFCRGDGELEILEEREENRYHYSRANVVYAPAAPGVYTNYYGNTNYGYWGDDGFYFNDPYSVYATQTNSFLLGAGLGGLATYAITRNSWDRDHANGWTETKRENKNYRGKDGVITKEEAARRKAQSKKDRAAHKAKLKAKAVKAEKENKALRKQLKAEQGKNKQAATNLKKATAKPSKDAQAAKKAELIAKAKARKEAKAAGKSTVGSKLAKNEQKAKQKGKNDKLKQQIIAKNAAKAKNPKKPTIGKKIAKSEKKAAKNASHKSSNKPHQSKPKKHHKPAKKSSKKKH